MSDNKPSYEDHPAVLAPNPPKKPLPAGACDSHAHVFGPYDKFPLHPDRAYTPPQAGFELYTGMLKRVGFSRGTPVHASVFLGFDAEATLDALDRAPKMLRGITVIDPKVTDKELEAMHQRGMRGARFKLATAHNAAAAAALGAVGFDTLFRVAPKFKELGWQAQIWASTDLIVAEAPRLEKLGIPVVLDHMAGVDVAKNVDDPDFKSLMGLLRDGQIWIKLSANRVTKRYNDYEDVRPFHDAMVKANPDQLVWGSDWPYLRMYDNTPHVGALIDRFDAWTGNDEAVRRKVFVDNPARLFKFD
jgi:predicted TIM-barrel fold metal-dependent hydrolase